MASTKAGEADFGVLNWDVFKSGETMNCVRSNKIKSYQSVSRILGLQFMSTVKGKTNGKCQHKALPSGCVSKTQITYIYLNRHDN